MYYIYILSSFKKAIYIGVTRSLEKRLFQHKASLVKGFTARYKINRLVYYEYCNNANDAIAREKELKGWLRSKKITLIEQGNPNWLDLSEDWQDSSLHSE